MRGSRAWRRGSSTASTVVGGGEGGVGQQRWRWVRDRLVRVGKGEVRHGPPVSVKFHCLGLVVTYTGAADGIMRQGNKGNNHNIIIV
jgi:hypothetical protein